MKIAIDARYLTRQYSGIGAYSERLLEALALQDKTNEYFCFIQPDYTRPINLRENFHIIRYGAPPLSTKTIFWLHRALRKIRPDFLHSLFPVFPVFYKGKLLVTVHDLQPLLMKEWTGGKRPFPISALYEIFYRWMYPYTFQRANWLIAVSHSTKDALSNLMPALAEKTIVVHSGVEPDAAESPDPDIMDALRKRYSLPERYILFVGSTRPNKNVPAMLRAFDLFLKMGEESRDIGFVMVLTKDRFITDITQIIRQKKLQPHIRILEPVNQAEKRALYHHALLLFFATKLEGFGFPVLEAQAQGTPVVASQNDSLPEISGDSALLVDPDDEKVMAEALWNAVYDKKLRAELIERGKSNTARFSWEKTARQMLEIYNHLM
ncbi:MAG TPA: glycosyltransferase family 1 protein [Candidatus Sumerlaeota bacterium]|nr:MAG: GDP-mannose-dependent alpha-(1-2)-phosphatidylinositol mannosyltransferase [candidate division BRC1 bacterium ADurb.Bin183]HOE63147.1 glycosyltransferase family 1 protein [Candidatus Sumerlaeota bacterium]HRR31621.1 glycosyltransferase family 1 protein [Candidatus Sumerlaeia bacterium]HON51538.1 glycosyltransferase family 1 protein [Candidatus Sumerlaeota bacterium]HOR65264.1 glycosyltransferase family 1 protein [Candidatus Sumerlaeota bacterium]